MKELDTSEFSHHEACPQCGSKDNLARYKSGRANCFGANCDYYEPLDTNHVVAIKPTNGNGFKFIEGNPEPVRGIGQESCKKYSYLIGQHDGQRVHIQNFYKNGKLIAQKLRKKGKKFSWIGDATNSGLFGQHLFHSGRKITITEGEIDCLSVSYIQDNKYPVVSITKGISGAYKEIQKAYEYLMGFEEIILMFDNDAIAPEIALKCASLFPIGKAKVATLPLKDANDMLKAGRGHEIVSAIWNSKLYKPDGIILGSETWDLVSKEEENPVFEYPWKQLNEKVHGVRPGIITLCAGSGLGKSQICRELAYSLILADQPLGYIALEESVRTSALALMSIHANQKLHINTIDDDQKLYDTWKGILGDKQVFFYDHFGSTEGENLLNKIHYLVKGCGARFIILDHLSIVVSDSLDYADERRLIDTLMTRLRKLVEELKISLFLVSHLKRTNNGKSHEEGAEPSLSDLRGSHAIAQLSDFCIGFSRNMYADSSEQHETHIKVLKNRFSGETGNAGVLVYDPLTGRLSEKELEYVNNNEEDEESDF